MLSHKSSLRTANTGFIAHKIDVALKKINVAKNRLGKESGKNNFLFKKLLNIHKKTRKNAPTLTNETGVSETVSVGKKGSKNKNQTSIPGSRNSTFY